MLALALHAVVPLAQGIPAPRAATPEARSHLVVCKALSPEATGKRGTPAGDERRLCPICQITHLGKTLVVPMASGFAPAACISTHWLAGPGVVVTQNRYRWPVRPRAPPVGA